MGFYSASQLIQDARRHKVKVLPVCINQSNREHSIQWQGHSPVLRLGIKQVQGLSEDAVTQLMKHRPEEGYTSVGELYQLGLNQLALQALASSDALSSIAGHRYQARWTLMDSQHSLPLFGEKSGDKDDDCSANNELKLSSPSLAEDMLEDYHSTKLSLRTHPIALISKKLEQHRIVTAKQLRDKAHQSFVKVIGWRDGEAIARYCQRCYLHNA